jgi:hypothetical protein
MTARKPMTFSVDTDDIEPPSAPAPLAPRREREERQQVGARVRAATYRKLKILAVTRDVPVQTLVEQAIVEFLDRMPG